MSVTAGRLAWVRTLGADRAPDGLVSVLRRCGKHDHGCGSWNEIAIHLDAA